MSQDNQDVLKIVDDVYNFMISKIREEKKDDISFKIICCNDNKICDKCKLKKFVTLELFTKCLNCDNTDIKYL